MPQYNAPYTDFTFLLRDWLKLDEHYASLGIGEFDFELASEIVNQGGKFAEEVIAPLNREGDEQGCKLENGRVTTPKGFAEAYQDYIQNGWNAMLGSADFDGQDLPYTMAVPVHEMLNSANFSWRLTTMLTESAVLAVTKHANDALKEHYLAKLISGEWTGTMNLTEPQAGSDLSLLNTKATPKPDGSYAITGNKIFITGGDHDWTSNIVHLVLARLPDAPKGVKGISLFLVPKFLLDENGEPSSPNNVSVGSIEKKMGIKASPTCVMNFDDATGWLVGEENNGLACMFTMMNDARFQVGLEGLGAAEASYQGALEYARERLQSRAPHGVQAPDKKADPIVFQPDVVRMLLTQKSLVEGCRAMSLFYAKMMDIEKYSVGENKSEAKHNAQKVIQYLTPICKAFMTDMAQEVTNLGVQVYGGHGYIREWGMEQLVRDARIAMLYEGTNGIQALDLIGRKLTKDGGQCMLATFHAFTTLIESIQDPQSQNTARTLLNEWKLVSEQQMGKAPHEVAAAASDYLAFSAYSLIGVLWYSLADVANTNENTNIAQGKMKTRDFYIARILPRKTMHLSSLNASVDTILSLHGSEFDYR